jgi:hypothetical protein
MYILEARRIREEWEAAGSPPCVPHEIEAMYEGAGMPSEWDACRKCGARWEKHESPARRYTIRPLARE